MDPGPIPDKLYFSIREASDIVQAAPHVLRYWEKEFPQLNPPKRAGNRRRYRRQDVELLLDIRHLLYDRGFTVNGAREHMKKRQAGDPVDLLQEVHRELLEINRLLTGGDAPGKKG